MQLSRDAMLLRIFIGYDKGTTGRSTRARAEGARDALAGATVLRGPMGRALSVLHTTKIVRLSQDLPLIIRSSTEERSTPSSTPSGHHGEAAGDMEKVKVINTAPSGRPIAAHTLPSKPGGSAPDAQAEIASCELACCVFDTYLARQAAGGPASPSHG
jgi:PII-like signaling protein